MTTLDKDLRNQCINALRFLAVEAVEKANSGHPGMAMGAATAAFVIWHDFLRLDPKRLDWVARDRFILSGGHASGLLYALLHCAGTGLDREDLEGFRQWRSRTPGHPEVGLTPGVETTTGPLGQGFTNGVGMGLSAKLLAARLGPEGEKLAAQRIFGLVSDGDIQEGISQEAASLAAHLGLGNLVYVYDSNSITIEGGTELSMSEDVGARFKAIGWHVQEVDGHDADALREAIAKGCEETKRPSFIVSRTHIGFGSPKQDTSSCHGSPLGAEALAAAREKLGWAHDPFEVPAEILDVWSKWGARGAEARETWEQAYGEWQKTNAEMAGRWEAMRNGDLPEDLLEQLVASVDGKAGATRGLSGQVLHKAAELVPALIGGSADLSPSNKTHLSGEKDVTASTMDGRNIHFGIREHAMASAANGMILHGPWRPYCGTFLVFSDYMRPAMRLAALMEQPVIYALSHDSFFVGEDGPTHQPVEHLWALRSIPGLTVYRPADGVEVAAAWTAALESVDSPHVIVLSRQGLPVLPRPEGFEPRQVLRGGYVLVEAKDDKPDVTFVATGSEVSLALEAVELLESEDIRARVVSMPCVERFLEQDESYRDSVLPPRGKLVALEAGITLPWHSIVGRAGLVIGLDSYGASAPADVLKEKLGFTPVQVAARVADWISGRDRASMLPK